MNVRWGIHIHVGACNLVALRRSPGLSRYIHMKDYILLWGARGPYSTASYASCNCEGLSQRRILDLFRSRTHPALEH